MPGKPTGACDDPSNRGTLYGSSIHRLLVQGYAHPIRGVIWYQGESDVGRGTELYLQDLEELVANYRQDLGDPGIFFGNCQLATFLGADLNSWTEIQEAQRQQAERDSLSAVVALVDQPLSDVIHLDVAGYKEAGVRLARAVLDGSYGVDAPLGPRLTSITYESGQQRDIVLTYDKEVTGGQQAGLFRVLDDGSQITVDGVTTSGNTVVLHLARRIRGEGRVSYGFSIFASSDWIAAAGGAGTALVFRDLPVSF